MFASLSCHFIGLNSQINLREDRFIQAFSHKKHNIEDFFFFNAGRDLYVGQGLHKIIWYAPQMRASINDATILWFMYVWS